MTTDRRRIEDIKNVLVSYANEYDKENGGYIAIQAVQKMAGESTVKDYVMALADGLKYGNWPWTQYSQSNIEKGIKSNPYPDTTTRHLMNNPLMCIHANENPNFCPCDSNCYCKSNTCKDKSEKQKYYEGFPIGGDE